jgi:hypothetical protein
MLVDLECLRFRRVGRAYDDHAKKDCDLEIYLPR